MPRDAPPAPWALALLLLLAPALAGCAGPPPPPTPDGAGSPGLTEADILALARTFDAERAWAHVEAQVLKPCEGAAAGDGGEVARCPNYRVPGTPNSSALARDLAAQLARLGFASRLQPFEATFEGRALEAQNVVAERPGRTPRTLYLGAHFDTRPCADKDPDPARRGEPVLGANDGASGVAVLLALLETLRDRPLNLTLRVVFFDAEDMGDAGLGCGRGTPWIQGSRHYVGTLNDTEVAEAWGMVLLDMVGDKDLELRREGHSARAPHRALQDDLWAWAGRLGHGQFRGEVNGAIIDDHAPFQERGIRAVDVIHLDAGPDVFPATHHTTSDDLANLDRRSLAAAGETLLAALLAWDADVGDDATTSAAVK